MRGDTMGSITEVVETTTPKLAKYIQMGCDNSLLKVIRAYLAKLRNDLHIDNGLTNENIKAIADRLTKDPELRWWLTIEDVALLCKKITRGEYGKVYGHFSEMEFNECLATYCRERAEIHRLKADKVTEVADPHVLEDVGYKVGKNGQIEVSNAVKEKRLPPPLYLYDAKGKRTGDNPEAWKKSRREQVNMDNLPQTEREKLEKINKSNKVMELTRALMKEDPTLGYVEAIDMAVEAVEKE